MQTARGREHKERKKPFLNKFTLQSKNKNKHDIYYVLAFHMNTANKERGLPCYTEEVSIFAKIKSQKRKTKRKIRES